MRSSYYIPKLLRDNDCLISQSMFTMLIFFAKKFVKEYSKILYFTKSFNYLPDEVFEKLNINLQNFIN